MAIRDYFLPAAASGPETCVFFIIAGPYLRALADPDAITQARIVHMILARQTEEALRILSDFYRIKPPEIAVGTVKGKRRTAYAVYVPREQKIYAMNSDIFYNPFVILHEFYHHIRSRSGSHRGTERHANMFAKGFIDSYTAVVSNASASQTQPKKD